MSNNFEVLLPLLNYKFKIKEKMLDSNLYSLYKRFVSQRLIGNNHAKFPSGHIAFSVVNSLDFNQHFENSMQSQNCNWKYTSFLITSGISIITIIKVIIWNLGALQSHLNIQNGRQTLFMYPISIRRYEIHNNNNKNI